MNELVPALPDLAAQINQEHQQCLQAANATLEHARKAGELLQQAKAQLEHGKWLPWLKEHFPFSEKTAQNYMRIAREWSGLLEANPQRAADLSYRDALKLLACSKTEEEDRLEDMMQRLRAQKLQLSPNDPIEAVHLAVTELCIKYAPIVFGPNPTLKELREAQRHMLEAENAAAEMKILVEAKAGGILNEAEKNGTKDAVLKMANLLLGAEAEGCTEEEIAEALGSKPKPIQYPPDLVEAALRLHGRLKELLAA
jgi:hypothetical protein